jgi:hypothetical protein
MLKHEDIVKKFESVLKDEVPLRNMDTNEAGRLLNIMEEQLGVLNNSAITFHTETAEQFKKYKDEWSKLFDMIEAHFVMYHPDDDEF